MGLDPFSKKKVGQYSLGMRERLGIAQAIMEDPKLLVLDEPFNGLDKRGAREVCDLLEELRGQRPDRPCGGPQYAGDGIPMRHDLRNGCGRAHTGEVGGSLEYERAGKGYFLISRAR